MMDTVNAMPMTHWRAMRVTDEVLAPMMEWSPLYSSVVGEAVTVTHGPRSLMGESVVVHSVERPQR